MTSAVSTPTTSTASPAKGLVCRACGAEFPLAAQHACYECFGPLEVAYDEAALARVTRAEIEAGPQNIWRYAALLPAGQDPAARVTLDPGLTPLVSAPALAAAVGVRAPLWVKDDSANPTHSFKDRVVSVALTAARGPGFTRFACASTGNLVNSVAAPAARAPPDTGRARAPLARPGPACRASSSSCSTWSGVRPSRPSTLVPSWTRFRA